VRLERRFGQSPNSPEALGSEMQNAIFGQLAGGTQTLDGRLSRGAAKKYAVLPTAKAAPDLAELM
jgi:hypothetical protein